MPDLKDKFRYEYKVVIALHHALGDGLDGSKVVQILIINLIDMLAGRPANKEVLAEFTEKKDFLKLKLRVKEKLVQNPDRASFVRSTMPPSDKMPSLLKIFPKPQVIRRTTGHVTRIVDSLVTQQLQQKAQEAQVSFNSCLMALINVAIVELARDAGIDQLVSSISVNVAVSLRPSLPQSLNYEMGPYNGLLSLSSKVDTSTKQHFWEYCKQLHRDVMVNLKEGLALEQEAVNKIDHPDKPVDEYYTNPQPVTHDYGLSNLGDLTGPMVEDFRLIKAFSYNLIHSFIHSNLHQMFIYHNQFYYTISYDTHYFSEEAVNIIIDKVQSVMKDVTSVMVVKASL